MPLKKQNRASWLVIEASSALVEKHLRTAGLNDNDLIEHYIRAAQEDVEADLNYPVIDCELVEMMPDFGHYNFKNISTFRALQINYWGVGASQYAALPTENFNRIVMGAQSNLVFVGNLPALENRPDAVQIKMQAGFATAADVPSVIKQAVMMRVGGYYANREETPIKYQQASERLLAKIRDTQA